MTEQLVSEKGHQTLSLDDYRWAEGFCAASVNFRAPEPQPVCVSARSKRKWALTANSQMGNKRAASLQA